MENSCKDLRYEIDLIAKEIGYTCLEKKIDLEENETFIWYLIDFGYPEDVVVTGRCSLQASLDFSMEKWEVEMKNDLKKLKRLKEEVI